MSMNSNRSRFLSSNKIRILIGPTFVMLVVALILFVLPSMILVSPDEDNPGEVLNSLQRLFQHYLTLSSTDGLLIIVVSILFLLCYHYFVWTRDYGHVIHAFSEKQTKKRIWIGLVICIVITVILIGFAAALSGVEWPSRLTNNPGGWFAIATGVASVLGVYLTLANVLDLRNSITSFASFLNKVDELIDETEESDYLRMMVLTPAMGCLVLPPRIWRSVADKIKRHDRAVELTCLCKDDEEKWFESYKRGAEEGDLASMTKRIADGIDESCLIRQTLRQKAAQSAGDKHIVPIEAKWDEMPQYYLIANRRRAIIVVPFFLPSPSLNIFKGNFYKRPVQMVGFDTADFHIVESVHQEIATRRNAIQDARKEKEVL
ncbi:hypothetical protein IYY11_14000 [Methylocystis sp. H62]|uniref:hypothetical protein n=1 Tax=Methylocystis sp. H62 TaxID=2785789 RepID=UPI0018C2D81A|nr:hypothetical protein [Methylocystis sp. H62]MBG0794465.1 hypothetical protein [Methylocystis sp. H62]